MKNSLLLNKFSFVFVIVIINCLISCSNDKTPTVTTVSIQVDAGTITGEIKTLWRDHYDLSITHLDYLGESGFLSLVQSLEPRYWRTSVGRWEIGMQPPEGGDSLDPAILKTIEREFYHGGNTLEEADDPGNYDFAYLDEQIKAILYTEAVPFLCFDYMPFTLSSEQDPNNENNFIFTDPDTTYTFSNGIRTAPPASNAVYARVVRNVIRHVLGLFDGTTDFGIEYVEIGNEPDLIDTDATPVKLFWTGSHDQWIEMYNTIASEINSDEKINELIKLGGGSFVFAAHEQTPRFLVDFLTDVALNNTRLDFLSYHSYGDKPTNHLEKLKRLQTTLNTLSFNTELINAEWGRALDGPDQVYDRIEHGLFRAKVMFLMQLFGVNISHEALLRDPISGSNQLGLITTNPPTPKPVSDCYRGLNLMNDTLYAISTTVPEDKYLIAGTNANGEKVVIIYVGDDPGAGNVTDVELTVINLRWGDALYAMNYYEVNEVTWASGEGVALKDTQTLSGNTFNTIVRFGPGNGAGQLMIWELIKQ